MSTPTNADSFVGGDFGLQIDSTEIGYVQKVDGLGFEVAAIAVKSNSIRGKGITKQMPGPTTMKEVTLVRATDGTDALSIWIKQAESGLLVLMRKNVSFFQNDTQGNPHKFFHLKNAWIKSWSLSTLESGSANPVTETVTFVHEGLTTTGA